MTRMIGGSALIGLLLGCAPAGAQEVGLGGSYGTTQRSDVVGGPGLLAWASYELGDALRLRASVGREWGEEVGHEALCGVWQFEGPNECVPQDVRRYTTTTTAELAALLLMPAWRGTRVGVGASYGLHWFDIGAEGLETGVVQKPVPEENRVWAPGLLVMVEHALRALPATVRASYQAYTADFGGCVLDTWSVCGDERLGRLSVGIGYRLH